MSGHRIILGAMGFGPRAGESEAEAVRRAHAAVDAALEIGVDTIDHADIYGRGAAESVYGAVLAERPELRERLRIQTKCGIVLPEDGVAGHYDLSGAHVRRAVEGSLRRLGTERIDVLLLHRPDPLMQPEELAATLSALLADGTVGGIGVSNMSAAQMAFVQRSLDAPLLADQLELSLGRLDWVDSGVHVNEDGALDLAFPQGTLEYCREHGVELQAWSPLARGRYSGAPDAPASAAATLVSRWAREKGTSAEAIVLGWLMRHPAGIRPVIGTTSPERIRAAGDAESQAASMTRQEWYELWIAARGAPLP